LAEVSQTSPGAHSVLLVQVVLQAVAPQANGAQSVVPGAGQLPMPSQMLGFCCVIPAQLSRIEPQGALGPLG